MSVHAIKVSIDSTQIAAKVSIETVSIEKEGSNGDA
jgi:hypothetical protein